MVPLVAAVVIMGLVIVLLYTNPLLRHDAARPGEPAPARRG
ncbi:hypothetical protein ACIBEJ_08115 [Nonomuraea sp. NPDC050790]